MVYHAFLQELYISYYQWYQCGFYISGYISVVVLVVVLYISGCFMAQFYGIGRAVTFIKIWF